MDKNKKIMIDEYVVREILEMTIEITLRVLLKIIKEKYMGFMKLYGGKLSFKDKQEELETKKYFHEAFIRELKKQNKLLG